MRVLLHIGTEKTGTTAIQAFLDRNRDTLAGHGVHVLRSPGSPNHRWVPSSCIADDRTDDFIEAHAAGNRSRFERRRRAFLGRFHDELAGLPASVHTLVISSEHFHSRLVRQAEVDAVGALLDGHADEVEVLCYLRPQVDTCVSLYSTAVKVGYDLPLDEWLERCHPRNPYYDYASLLDRWATRFGHDAMVVRLFDRRELHQGDLLDDVTAVIAPQLVGLLEKDGTSFNESLTPDGQLLGRAVNRALHGRAELRTEAIHVVSELLTGAGQQPSLGRRQQLEAAFASSNETVRATYFPDREVLFAEPTAPVAGPETGEDLIEAIAQVLDLVTSYGDPPVIRPPRRRGWRRAR